MQTILAKDIHVSNGNLEIFLFNVGQGDHLLIKFPANEDGAVEYGIIDFHYDLPSGTFEPPCLSYFKELKETLPESEFKKITISFFCISHTDKDHVKGIAQAIKWFHDEEIFIKDFWLGAARDKLQLDNFLTNKIDSLIDKFRLAERIQYNPEVNVFKKGVKEFFYYFEKWKQKKFKSKRYQNEATGNGEYLVEIRSLRNPSSSPKTEAMNIGPLNSHLDKYINNATLDTLKDILKIKDNKNSVDKNLLSHILKIKFGEVNLLFGGDTDKDIWEECLTKYEDSNYPFFRQYGNYDSHFIKVSHHGSKNSSSPTIWKKIIPDSGKAYLGVSAGRNNRYRHPHSETMTQIRDCRNEADILSTNICKKCLDDSQFEKEYHKWYDDYIIRNENYLKSRKNDFDKIIDQAIRELLYRNDGQDAQQSEMGLLAFVIEVPDNLNEEIKVRIALSKTNRSHSCFFTDHNEKLFNCCE